MSSCVTGSSISPSGSYHQSQSSLPMDPSLSYCLLLSPLLPLLAWLYLRRKDSLLTLRGRTILITGCDSGYGHSLALHCSNTLGMRVLATCFTQGEGRQVLEQTAGVTVVHLDITNTESRALLHTQVTAWLEGEGLHCLVNNAATLVFGEAMWQTEDQVVNQVSVNMVGPLLLTRAMLPHLAKGKGRVITVVSNCTYCPLPLLSVYTGSKAGILAATEAIRPELAKYGINTVTVNPGDAPMETAITGGQEAHYNRMWECLSVCERSLYGEYFTLCKHKFTSFNSRPQLQTITDPSFYRVMEASIGTKQPESSYDNSPALIRVIFRVVGSLMLPSSLRDWAKLKIMDLPEYRP